MSKQEIKEKTGTTKTASSKAMAFVSEKDLGVVAPKADVTQSYAVWVRVLMQNWRQGTVGCKARGDVTSRSTKKPWKQKGTGRARAGSARSPLWRGGGVTFGPQARVKTLKIAKQSKNAVVRALFATYVKENRCVVLDVPSQDKPSTKAYLNALEQIGLHDKKISLFVQRDDLVTGLSLRNVPNVQLLAFDALNAYNLSSSDYLVVIKKDLDLLKEVVATWN